VVKLAVLNDLFVLLDNDNQVQYLVPGKLYVWDQDGAPIFIHRLASTRGRKAARWESSEAAASVLNGARYCPVVRGYLRRFIWGGPKDDISTFRDDSIPYVIQQGTGVPNFSAAFWGPLEDPVRRYLAALLEKLDQTIPLAEQGHLRVFRAEEPPEEIRRRVPDSNKFQPVRYFNHCICASYYRPVWRVIGGTAVGIIRADGEIAILSADHEDRPVILGDGWYFLIHPFPQPQRQQPVD
jgi:hypothetical protein